MPSILRAASAAILGLALLDAPAEADVVKVVVDKRAALPNRGGR